MGGGVSGRHGDYLCADCANLPMFVNSNTKFPRSKVQTSRSGCKDPAMKKWRDQMLNGAHNARPFLHIHNGGFVQKVEKGGKERRGRGVLS